MLQVGPPAQLGVVVLKGPLLESANEAVSKACSLGALLESASEAVSICRSIGDLLESANEMLSSLRVGWGFDHFAESLTTNCLKVRGMAKNERNVCRFWIEIRDV